MKNANIIKALIIFMLVLSGSYVWYPHETGDPVSAGIPQKEETADAEKSESAEESHSADGSDDTGVVITDGLKNDIKSGYLILVNKEHGLGKDYEPDDLAGIKYFAPDRPAEARYLRAAAAAAFHSLVEEAGRLDMNLVMTTGYRSYEFQAMLYDYYTVTEGREAADRYSAQPGKSEHQTGLAADVSSPSVNFELTPDFADTADGKWLAENAHLFGFIIRFPEGSEDVTGYRYEPWHIRYVGPDAADYIYSHKITLEEYLQLLSEDTEE
jgi:D-alanyl-D-alanine carboxypeptidase